MISPLVHKGEISGHVTKWLLYKPRGSKGAVDIRSHWNVYRPPPDTLKGHLLRAMPCGSARPWLWALQKHERKDYLSLGSNFAICVCVERKEGAAPFMQASSWIWSISLAGRWVCVCGSPRSTLVFCGESVQGSSARIPYRPYTFYNALSQLQSFISLIYLQLNFLQGMLYFTDKKVNFTEFIYKFSKIDFFYRWNITFLGDIYIGNWF